MAYKNYTATFYSERNNRFDLELWSKSDTSTGNTFETGKGGFRLSYKGSDNRRDTVMPSELTFQFIVQNSTQQTFLTTLLAADDGEYFLVARRNFVIIWFGNLNSGYDSIENDVFPYEITLKANDFLGELMNDKTYYDISASPLLKIGEALLGYYIYRSQIYTHFLADVFPRGNDELIFFTNNRWTGNNVFSTADTYNRFFMNYVDSRLFEAGSNEAGKYYKSDAFQEILKCWGMKMFIADGRVMVIQPAGYIDNTTKIQRLKHDGSTDLIITTTIDVDNRQNASNDSSVSPTVDSGFTGTSWLQNPADFTTWSSSGSVTSITATSFNIALTTSYMYVDLTEGDYRVSFSQNNHTTKIVYANTSSADNELLTRSGEANFSIGASGGRLKIMATTTGTKTVEFIGLQKGNFEHRRFLTGQRWRYLRPISSVTGTFNHGQSSAVANSNFPASTDTSVTTSIYSSALTNIGAFSTAQADNIQMQINVFYAEKFDYLSAANNFTHIGGTLTLKLKLGSLYLSGTVGGDLTWESSDSSFTVNVPIALIENNFQSEFTVQTAMNSYCNYFKPNSTLPIFFSGTGSIGAIGINQQIDLPDLSVGGSVDLQFVSATINYYINPDTSNPNTAPTPLTPTKNNLSSLWLTGSNFAGYGDVRNFLLNFEGEQGNNGIQFSASTGLDNFKNEDFGSLKLGTTGAEDSYLNAIRVLDSSGTDISVPDSIQVEGTGTNYNMTSLLLEEYLAPQTQPLKIIEGEYYVNDFSAFKTIVLDSEKYVFIQGNYTAETDTVSGSWYKMSAASSTITNVETTTINPPIPSPPPPNPHDELGTIKHSIFNDVIYQVIDPTIKKQLNTGGKLLLQDNLIDFVKYNSIGLSNGVLNSAASKVQLINASRSALYDNQKLVLCRPDLSYPIVLTKDGASTTSTTDINVDSFTPSVEYPKGSILSLLPYDLTNVITGGGGGTPAGSDTQIQFNDGGSFGASPDFTYDSSNDKLILTSSTSGRPRFEIHSNANSQFGSQFTFKKDRGVAPTDNDTIGSVRFVAEDSAQNETFYGQLAAKIQETQSGQEGGRVFIQVASHDGEAVIGLDIFDGNAEDEIDVNIASGTSSLTTIAGNLQVNGNFLPNITEIKILPSDFIADDVGRPLMIDDSTGNRWLKSHNTAKMYASIKIPEGRTATQLHIYGSGLSAVTVYEATIDSNSVSSKGTGYIGTTLNFTDVAHSDTNYLLIELEQTSTEKVYGGKLTIT